MGRTLNWPGCKLRLRTNEECDTLPALSGTIPSSRCGDPVYRLGDFGAEWLNEVIECFRRNIQLWNGDQMRVEYRMIIIKIKM